MNHDDKYIMVTVDCPFCDGENEDCEYCDGTGEFETEAERLPSTTEPEDA